MHSTNAVRKDLFTPGSVINEITIHGWTWKGVGALVGLGGGLISPLAGSVFTVIGWVTRHTWHGVAVNRIDMALFVVTLPLLIFGAHCLDLIEKEGKRT
jgi:hypothetical protein